MTTYAPARPGMRRIPVNPKIRARRVAVIREQGRRRLRRLLVIVGLLATVGALTGAVLSPLLAVNDVAVSGVSGPHAEEVRAALRGDVGEPLLLVDTGAAVTAVEALPWVDRASVDRQLPGTLRVEVTPRFPVGWRSDAAGRVLMVDSLGGVVTVADAAPAGLPKLLSAGAAGRGAARVAAALSPTLRPLVGAIAVENGEATMSLINGPQVRLGALHELSGKGRAVEALLRALGGTPVTYIDVRVPSSPVTG